MRRKNNRNQGQQIPTPFDPNQFRRSAVMLHDPPRTQADTFAPGFNSPSMTERRISSPPPTYAPTVASMSHTYGDNKRQSSSGRSMHSNVDQPSTPTQMMNQPPEAPLFSPSAYGQSPFSPITTSPVAGQVPSYDSATAEHGQSVIRPLPSPPAQVLTRQSSASSGRATLPGSRKSPPTNDYIDLNRSSVSPYQAAQYAEISRKLSSDVPRMLDTEAAQKSLRTNTSVEVSPVAQNDTVSPFADPVTPVEQNSDGSTTTDNSLAPPIPRTRVDSTPPMLPEFDSSPPILPEINIQDRVSAAPSYDFPASVHDNTANPSPVSLTFPNGAAPGTGGGLFADNAFMNNFPVTPSPLASSFTLSSPPAAKKSFETQVHLGPSPLQQEVNASVRPESVYDPDDAYGGI